MTDKAMREAEIAQLIRKHYLDTDGNASPESIAKVIAALFTVNPGLIAAIPTEAMLRREFEYECPVFDFDIHPAKFGYADVTTEQAFKCYRAGRIALARTHGVEKVSLQELRDSFAVRNAGNIKDAIAAVLDSIGVPYVE